MSKQIISCISPKWIVSPAIDDLCRVHPVFYDAGSPRISPYFDARKYFKAYLGEHRHPEDVVFYHNNMRVPAYIQVSCGECFCCNETRRQDIAQRILLEMTSHDYPPVWCTLTYREDDYNKEDYSDFQEFIKRLRTKYNPGLKFMAVGEYGAITKRWHWHCFVFGIPFPTAAHEIKAIDDIEFSWRLGNVYCRVLDNVGGTAKYVTKYVTKQGRIIQKWSKGLGVSAVARLREYFAQEQPTVEPKYLDYFGNLRKLRVNSWVLDVVFGNVARSTYILRNLVKDYVCSEVDYLPVGLRKFLRDIGCPLEHKQYDKSKNYPQLLSKITHIVENMSFENILQNRLKRYEYIARFDNTLSEDLVRQREHIYKLNYYRRKSFSIL